MPNTGDAMQSQNSHEQRMYTRVPLVVPVNIYYDDCFIARYKTKNISVGGLLIAAPGPGFTENGLIEVQFDVENSRLLLEEKIPAIVKRISDDQLAVSFELINKDLEELMHMQCRESVDHNTTGDLFTLSRVEL